MNTMIKATLAALGALALGTGAALAQVNLTAETSSPGNSPHVVSVHMADVLAREGIANVQLQEGQTATNSIVNVAEGKTDMVTSPLVLHFLLEKGRGPFSSQGENGAVLAANLRALFPYNAGGYGLMAHVSTGIDSWDDLKGKTVWNGPPRGAALVQARQLIQFSTGGFQDGEDYTGLQTNWGQLPTVLVDGSADAIVVPLTSPSDRTVIMLSAGDVNLISVPKDIWEGEAFGKFLKSPGVAPIEIAEADLGYGADQGVNLISEDGVFRVLGIPFATMANADMPDDVAKAIVATHIATLDELKARAPYAGNVNFGVLEADKTGFCGALTLKYHPGAIAAWEEAGYTVPDCAK